MRLCRLFTRLRPAVPALGIVSAVAMTSAGCGSTQVRTTVRGERTVVEATADRPPNWVTREPESDAQYHYFRGMRTDAPSLEAGETDARQNALASIVQFLGLRVTVDYQRMRTEEKTAIEDALRSVGGADIFGTRLSELYYRRWRIQGDNSVRDAYDVYVLIRFPRASVERIKENQQERLRNIERMMSGPGFMASPGEMYGQINQAAQALGAIADLNNSVLITTQTEGQAENLERQARARLIRLIGGLRLSVAPGATKVTTGNQDPPLVVRVNVATEHRGQIVPAPNVPVKVTFGDSTHSHVAWSDEQGAASWQIHDIPFNVGARLISARIELPDGVRRLPDVMRTIPTASTSVEVVPVTELVKLLVVLEERVAGVPTGRRTGEARLVSALRDRGFTVISAATIPTDTVAGDPWSSERAAVVLAEKVGATMLLRGMIETDEPTPVQMMQDVLFATAHVKLTLTDLSTGTVVASVALPDGAVQDTKGFGNSPERAAENALMLNRGASRGQPNGYTHVAELVQNAISR